MRERHRPASVRLLAPVGTLVDLPCPSPRPSPRSTGGGGDFFYRSIAVLTLTASLAFCSVAVLAGEDAAPSPAAETVNEPDIAAGDRDHWAFRPLHVIAPPKVRDPSWPANGVDQFILAKLDVVNL